MKRFHHLALGILLLVAAASLVACGRSDDGEIAMTDGKDWFVGRTLYEVYLRSYSEEGSFAALTADLDRLADLGVKTLWLMPVQPLGEEGRKGSAGSPYSVRDYFDVGREYGSREDFAELVREAHNRGLRVILDVVMNHSANDYPLMDSKPDMWMRDEDGEFVREVADWSDITDWNHENPETVEYLTEALLYWVEEVNIDGFRCDVAGMVPREFWDHAIGQIREEKPNVFMLAEWEDPWVLDAGFDAAYDWNLYHRMRDHRRGEISLDSLWSAVEQKHQLYPHGKQPMRFIENHDEPRAADAFGWPELKPYAALIFTLPGIPLLYSGQEIGETHKPSLFEPEPIDWELGDPAVVNYYQSLLALRNGSDALLYGSTIKLPSQGDDVLLFQRVQGNERALVAINFSGAAKTVHRPASIGGGEFTDSEDGTPLGDRISIPAQGYRVFLLS